VWSRLVALLSRLRFALVRPRVDQEAQRELEAHLDLLIDRYVRLGMTPDDAQNAARRQLGNSLLVREEIHDMNHSEQYTRVAIERRADGRWSARVDKGPFVTVSTVRDSHGDAAAWVAQVIARPPRPLVGRGATWLD
jgi:hypothetical protein